MRAHLILLTVIVTASACDREVTVGPSLCREYERIWPVETDHDVGLGFTVDELAASLQEGREVDVDYNSYQPPSGEPGARFVFGFQGEPFDALHIDRRDSHVMPPGTCINGHLYRFSMQSSVTWTLNGESVTLTDGRVDIEANGLEDHRVMISSSFDLPFDQAPAEIQRQVQSLGLPEVDRIESWYQGRIYPHERMDYGVWGRSTALVSAQDDLENGDPWDGAELFMGEWRPPDRDTDTP